MAVVTAVLVKIGASFVLATSMAKVCCTISDPSVTESVMMCDPTWSFKGVPDKIQVPAPFFSRSSQLALMVAVSKSVSSGLLSISTRMEKAYHICRVEHARRSVEIKSL